MTSLKINRRETLIGMGALAATAAGGGFARAQSPVTITVAWAAVPTELHPLFFRMPERLKNYGKSYNVNLIRVRGSGQQITAMAAGELHVGGLAPTTLVYAVKNAKLDDIKIVMDGGQDGVNGHFSNQFVVRKDSDIKKVEDLKGKVIATNGIGGSTDSAMRKLLRDRGVDPEKDVRVVEINFANMVPALEEGKVDMVSLPLPFAYFAKKSGRTRVIGTVADALGANQKNFIVMRGGFVEKHRGAVVDLFEDMLIGYNWLLDPANRNEAIKMIADFNQSDPDKFEWVFTQDDTYRPPELRPDIEMLKKNMKTMLDAGMLKDTVDVDKYVDLSLLNEAAGRLKKS